ncbi:hypothetical protein FACS1894132_12110 [Clostridia bacterium]|nr:hypothetical protein FACS1894132_12110 [Clostridia bacterium]
MAILQINVESIIEQQANTIFKALGLSITDAVNMFLIQSVNHRGLPFTPTIENISDDIIEAITEAENHIGKLFKNQEEAEEWLNA